MQLQQQSQTKKSSPVAEFIWQDREIRFDIPPAALQCRPGEKLVDSIPQVDDTKGNNGEQGHMVITNLRLIWYSDANQRINLSVGFDCILNTEIKETTSAIKGTTLALYLRTRFQQARYEFIFSSVVQNNPRLFSSFQAVIRSYETTKLYRDLKLRSSIIQDKQLVLLPNEKIFTKYQGVWNLSAEQGNLGTFVITDVRVVWFAQLSDNFNVSLPWVQLKCVRVRESKYGTALVLETSEFSGGYVLGFRVEQLDEAYTEICQLFKTFTIKPYFGVECVFEDIEKDQNQVSIPIVEENLEIVDTGYESHLSALRLRYQIGRNKAESKNADEKFEIEVNQDLGLACERLPKGLDIDYSILEPYVETEPKINGFFADVEDQSCTVKVAVRVRPMNNKELREGGKNGGCIQTTTDLSKLQIGTKEFFFDKVFDSESNQQEIFDICAHNLVLGCFSGYNATILAYGQTGSGKTHTMGTGSTIGFSAAQIGIVPRVFDQIFEELEIRRRQYESSLFEIKVQFLELYGEELHDLLDTTSVDKITGQSTKTLQIREEKNGTINVQGLKGEIVTSKLECISLLNKGISQRVTSATNMNEGSSRSHAIFTVIIQQKIIKQQQSNELGVEPVTSEENISAKFHFVDLAGSERIKKTGATGKLMQEGISINKGLLVLGNVIAALTEEKKIANGSQFIPYRDSKLTRILQDSLGGNSRTTMIACASPADSNIEESLSTIKYASRARNIKNKPKVNRDLNSILIESLRKQIASLLSENSQLMKLLEQNQVKIPEGYLKTVEIPEQQKVKTSNVQPQQQPAVQSQQNHAQSFALVAEMKDLKLKFSKKEKENREIQQQNQDILERLQTLQRNFDQLQSERDDLILRSESQSDNIKSSNILTSQNDKTSQNTSADKNSSAKRTQSLVEEYKSKLTKLQSELNNKIVELQQKTNKILELQGAMKRDEGVMRKTMDDYEKLKREIKRPAAPVATKVIEQKIPDMEEIKQKFFDQINSQMDNLFETNALETEQENDLTQQVLDQTKNSSLDEKEQLLISVKQNNDKLKQSLSEIMQSSWNSKIAEIKNTMKTMETDRQKKISADGKLQQQFDNEFKVKMEGLKSELDSQQKEKSKKEEQIQKQMFLQETRVKSLETELSKLRREKEEIDNQRKFGEERFHKFKNNIQKEVQLKVNEVQQNKKIVLEKDKTVAKLKADLKKTEMLAQQKIQELKNIQKRALDDKIKRERDEANDLEQKGIDIDAIKEWIKLNTEALLNQQELNNYLKEQCKAKKDIEDEMMQEGDRLTELMIQKERLESESNQLIAEGSKDEARMFEIEAELEDVILESNSINQTLDTLEEHLNFVQTKVTKLTDEIQAWDPESIKPPSFRGLNSIEMARATLKTFFMVLLDLNVYKRDLETKCIEQDETILELQSAVNLMQERVGMSAGQREVMMQKQKMINQMIGKMGDNVEFVDQREIIEMGLSKEEHNQLTKMSLSKIVGNLRSKLKDEERKNQTMSVKVESLLKEKERLKLEIDNFKREKKLNETYVKPQPSPALTTTVLSPKPKSNETPKKLNDQKQNVQDSTQQQIQQLPIQPSSPAKTLSLRQRRDIVKEIPQDKTALAKTQQNVDSLTPKKQSKGKQVSAPIPLKDRRIQKQQQPEENKADMKKKIDLLQKDVAASNKKQKDSESQKQVKSKAILIGKNGSLPDVVPEANLSEESSQHSNISFDEGLPTEESQANELEFEQKYISEKSENQASKPIDLNSSAILTFSEPSIAPNDVTFDAEQQEEEEENNKWQLKTLIEISQEQIGINFNTILDFDSQKDRLFVISDNFSLLEISLKSGKLIEAINIQNLENIDIPNDNELKVSAFSVFKDLNIIAISTKEAVYLLDIENDLKFKIKIELQNVFCITIVDNYIVMLVQDEETSEISITSSTLTGEEMGSFRIDGEQGQKIQIRPANNSVIYSCGSKLSRVSVPEMQLQWLDETEHKGEIQDFDCMETCIFTTATDSCLRLFDIDSGVMLIAPMEGMECDYLAKQDQFIVARCGQGKTILVLKYNEGQDELEDIAFIELQNQDSGLLQLLQQKSVFKMKGGHQVSNLQDDKEFGAIIVADLNAHHLSIRTLENRSYIT